MGPNYRLIRSLQRPRWRIEQKVSRATEFPGSADRARLVRDGYHLVVETPDSDSGTCPRCRARLALPVFEKREFDCQRCVEQGRRQTTLIDGYFPLVDKTLLYLERRHPHRTMEFIREIDAEADARSKAKRADARNVAEDLALDNYKRIMGIPQFAYNSRRGTPNAWGGTYFPTPKGPS